MSRAHPTLRLSPLIGAIAILVIVSCGPAEPAVELVASPAPTAGKYISRTMPLSRPTPKARSTKNPCRELVDRACDFLGRHSQECVESLARVPPAPRRDVRRECREIIEFFELTFANDQDRNPCLILARRKCNDVGRRTQICADVRANVKRYNKRHHRRACKGDLLLWEARGLLTPR